MQKVAEAEALAWGGVLDILVSNQVAGDAKLARFAMLSSLATVAICADRPYHVDRLAAEAATVRAGRDRRGHGLGRDRAGPGPEAVALAERIAALPHLQVGGLQAYHGTAQYLRTTEEWARAIGPAVDDTRRTIEQLRQREFRCPIVGGAGTGTFELEAASGVYTEIQVGSYCFMDADYTRNQGGTSSGFHHALFVLATVMSQVRPGLAVLDAGHKAVAVDGGLPLVWERSGVRCSGALDEHGKLEWAEGDGVRLGKTLRLIPGYCDLMIDRFDWYVSVRKDRVECLWPVAARSGFN